MKDSWPSPQLLGKFMFFIFYLLETQPGVGVGKKA